MGIKVGRHDAVFQRLAKFSRPGLRESDTHELRKDPVLLQ
jgi:hypothetical protein